MRRRAVLFLLRLAEWLDEVRHQVLRVAMSADPTVCAWCRRCECHVAPEYDGDYLCPRCGLVL